MTTIKVPVRLRERVQQHARRERVSQAAILERALDLLDRECFFDRLTDDVAAHPESVRDAHERDMWLAGSVAVPDRSER